jgi:hypothetical protein
MHFWHQQWFRAQSYQFLSTFFIIYPDKHIVIGDKKKRFRISNTNSLNKAPLKGALATILTKKIICFGNHTKKARSNYLLARK